MLFSFTISVLSACSLNVVDETPCTNSAQCQDAFGWGHQCVPETGLCAETTLPDRCSETVPANLFAFREDYPNAIVFGSVYWSTLFPLEVDAIKLAFEEVNQESGIGGRPVGLVVCSNDEGAGSDNLSQDDANVEMTRFLAEDLGAAAIIGPPTSSQAEGAYHVASLQDTVLVSPSATSTALTDLDGIEHSDANPGLLWRTAPPDDLQGSVLAQLMNDKALVRVAIIYEEGPYGEGLAEVTRSEVNATVDLYEFQSDTSRNDAVTNVASSASDGVLFISADKDDTTAFLNSAGALAGYDSKALFLPDAGYDTAIFSGALGGKHLFPNITGTIPSTPAGDVYDFFLASFAGAYAKDASSSGYTAYAYDAAWLAIYGTVWALRQEGAVTGTNIARGLRQVSAGEPVDIKPTSWNTVQTRFAAGQSVNVVGASGDLDFNPLTEETSAPIDVWITDGTSFQVIDTVVP